MKARIIAASLLVMSLFAGGAANAVYVGICAYEFNAIGDAIGDATFTSRNSDRDEAGLLGKLDDAVTKVQQQKYDDAIQKLEDIRDKATALAGARKSKLDSAAAINDAVGAAIACVGGL